MLPNFIGIGAPKAGTTWLFRCLQEHPEVYMAPVKETKFFDDESIEGRRAEYEAHFAGADGAKAVGEISIRYLASKRGAAERIRRWIPDVRLFVSLRNPIDQIWSHYWHLRRQNFHQTDPASVPATVEEAMARYPELLLEPSLYGKHLAHWLGSFDREQLLVVLYDDIAIRPEAVIRQIYRFIGVDPDFVPASLGVRDGSVRRGASPRTPWLGVAHQTLYATLHRRMYGPLKHFLGSWRAERIKNGLHVRQIMELLFMRPGYPPIPETMRQQLTDIVAEDLRCLERLIDRDLTAWHRTNRAEGLRL